MATRNRTLGKELTTSSQDVYTVPPRFFSSIESIVISNKTANTVSLTLNWYSSDIATSYPLFYSVPIYGNTIVQITDSLELQSADKITALASANSALTISVRVKEEYSVVV